jgi:rhamnosyltransferase
MTEKSVCAVIVTYHPNSAMIENLSVTFTQVNGMIVVDNGSNPEALRALRAAKKDLGFHLIENQENLGVAGALNQGVRWAIANGYPWVILFDQDSRITERFIVQMFASWESHPERDRVGSLHPRYVDPDSDTEPYVWRAHDGGPVISLTSGALMHAWIFEKVGFFAAEFFIDWVDIEYSFRIRAAGFLLADSRNAVLHHAAGQPVTKRLFGIPYRPLNHNPMRQYYISRNRLVVWRKYFRVFPIWIIRSIYVSLKETVKCLIGEKDRFLKLRNMFIGSWDGLRGRMGKYDEVE